MTDKTELKYLLTGTTLVVLLGLGCAFKKKYLVPKFIKKGTAIMVIINMLAAAGRTIVC